MNYLLYFFYQQQQCCSGNVVSSFAFTVVLWRQCTKGRGGQKRRFYELLVTVCMEPSEIRLKLLYRLSLSQEVVDVEWTSKQVRMKCISNVLFALLLSVLFV